MQIYKITKGNFALENTRDIRPHENNLRFHIKIYVIVRCSDFGSLYRGITVGDHFASFDLKNNRFSLKDTTTICSKQGKSRFLIFGDYLGTQLQCTN